MSINDIAGRLEGMVAARPGEIAGDLVAELRGETPKDTGATANAWESVATSDGVAVRNPMPHIRWLNYRGPKRLFVENSIDAVLAKERGDVLGK